MTAAEFNRHQTPPGGWFFRQPQTGWTAPTPISSTFSQTVQLIIAHRKANPAITAQHKLATNQQVVENELEVYTRKRLGIPETALPFPSSHRSFAQGAVGAVADRISALQRAAQNTAIPIEWFKIGGAPVEQELANRRAAICVSCPRHEKGEWYTVAAGEVIKKTIELRADLKLDTDYDDKLQSCGVCGCLLRAKVHVPLSVIFEKTKPDLIIQFPTNCWVYKRDQI